MENRALAEVSVDYEPTGRVGVITLNRPERRNALTIDTYREAGNAVRACNAAGCSVIVMRSVGKHFCSGGDLNITDGAADRAELVRTQAQFNGAAFELFSALNDSAAVVVAAVRGYCLAGGLIITLLSDVVVADTTSMFGVPEGRVGIGEPFMPALLPRRVGDLRAREMMLQARFVTAQEAVEWGLATHVCDPDELEDCVERSVANVLELSAYSRSYYKRCLHRSGPALVAAPEASTDDDSVEGVRAFTEKRLPSWNRSLEPGWLAALSDQWTL